MRSKSISIHHRTPLQAAGPTSGLASWREVHHGTRRGAALLATLFVMTVASLIVVAILETQTSEYAALRNTIDYDRARYLAEAGLHRALATLEADYSWRGTVSRTEFPTGSGNYYQAVVENGPAATVVVTGIGESGDVTRTVQAVVKQGG